MVYGAVARQPGTGNVSKRLWDTLRELENDETLLQWEPSDVFRTTPVPPSPNRQFQPSARLGHLGKLLGAWSGLGLMMYGQMTAVDLYRHPGHPAGDL